MMILIIPAALRQPLEGLLDDLLHALVPVLRNNVYK